MRCHESAGPPPFAFVPHVRTTYHARTKLSYKLYNYYQVHHYRKNCAMCERYDPFIYFLCSFYLYIVRAWLAYRSLLGPSQEYQEIRMWYNMFYFSTYNEAGRPGGLLIVVLSNTKSVGPCVRFPPPW